KQKEDEIFISQDKYVTEILKKFSFTDVKIASTPMETQKPLLKDEDGKEVDVHLYRSMIGSLMYRTSSRPDIMFAVCACAKYQVNPKVSHLYAVKRIFRYLKGQPKLGLWYPKDSPFDLVAYTNSDYAGASLDRKSTTGDCQFLRIILNTVRTVIPEKKVVIRKRIERVVNAARHNLLLLVQVNAARHNLLLLGYYCWFKLMLLRLQALVDGKKVIITESTVRRDLHLEDAEGVDCLPNATIFEQLTLMGYKKLSQKLTFYKAFFSPQWKFLIHIILQCLSAKTTAWNGFSSTMASAIICLVTNKKFNFSKYIFESMVKNLDSVGNFLMYPRFVQVFLNKQVDGMSKHNGIYVTPSHIKKIFGNMKRVRKGFSRSVTPLFLTMVVQAQEEIGEGSANLTDSHQTPTIIQPSTLQLQKKQKSRKPRKDTQISQSSGPTDNVTDEAVNEEMDDSLERAATTATSLDTEQDKGNINTTQSKATPNEPSSLGTSSGGVNTPRSDKDSLKLKKLMKLCTNLQNRVIDLEKTKTSQAQEITSLKRRVKRLENKNRLRTHGLKRLYKVGLSSRIESSEEESLGEEDASKHGRIDDIDANEDIYLVNVHKDEDMFGVDDIEGDEVIVETEVDHEVVVETEVASKDVNLSVDEVTLAQALATLKSAKPKADKVMIQEPEQGTITTTTIATTVTAASTRPKSKGLVIHEEEQVTTPIVSSQQLSQVKVQDKGKRIMVEEPLKMKKKDQVSFDEQEAIRLHDKFDEEERLVREKDKANVALTKEWNDILAKIDADYQLAQRLQAQEQEELTDEEKARLFVQFLEQRRKHFVAKRVEEKRNRPPTRAQQKSIITEVEESSKKAEVMEESSKNAKAEIAQESSSKRAREALEQESSKKAKTRRRQRMYLTFGKMLKNFNREDLEVLWSIVKARFKKIYPVNYMDNFLLLNLKTMFEHHVEDSVWKNQQGLAKVLNWKLYDSYGMFSNVKLQVDYECKMAFKLLRLVKKHLKEGYVPE
ncbi:hypothetical protein Tco_0997003, partial [Tanacetum coccineum]